MTARSISFVKVSLNVLLLAATIWAASGDFCLIGNAPKTSAVAMGSNVFAAIIQLLALGAIYTGINHEIGYFRTIATWVHSAILKSALFFIPFLFLLGSHEFVANAVYSTSGDDKLQNAGGVYAAQGRCRSSCWWPASCL